MKLYAMVTCGDYSRPAKKGSNDHIEITLTRKGLPEYVVTYTLSGVTVHGEGGILLQTGKDHS